MDREQYERKRAELIGAIARLKAVGTGTSIEAGWVKEAAVRALDIVEDLLGQLVDAPRQVIAPVATVTPPVLNTNGEDGAPLRVPPAEFNGRKILTPEETIAFLSGGGDKKKLKDPLEIE